MISGIKLDCRGSIYSHCILIGDINTITVNSNNVFTLGNYQLIVNPPTATSGASIQTMVPVVLYALEIMDLLIVMVYLM